MVSIADTSRIAAEGGVGSIFADIVVSNNEDEILARNGHLPPAQIRRAELKSVLVDTGALTLCLPESVVAQLGLPLKRRVMAATAGGTIETAVHDHATIAVEGREGVSECLAVPDGARPLLGVVPLEMLGLEPDLVKQQLRLLPDDTLDTYILA
ncbi:MAG TPA: aspartyl protease family protein [Tepidiformaceae bacterium]|jgi:clan AA aspartic protease|nr:aspartyl protease family protein [Tepidiformaceae bacterium]